MKLHRSSEFLNEIFEPKKVEGRDAIRKQQLDKETKPFIPLLEKALEHLDLGPLVSIDDYSTINDGKCWTLNTKKVGKSSLEQWYTVTIRTVTIRSDKSQLYSAKVDLIVGSINHTTQTFELGKVVFYKSTGDLAKLELY